MALSDTQSSLQDSDAQIAGLLEQAKADFERETHQKLNVLRHFDTVDEFIEQIRREKTAFGSFREHEHPNFFRHIRNALKPIQILAKIFAGPASNVSVLSHYNHFLPLSCNLSLVKTYVALVRRHILSRSGVCTSS